MSHRLEKEIPERSFQLNMKTFQMFALGSVLAAGLVMAQAPSTPSTPSSAGSAASTAKTAASKVKSPPPSAADIADAKSKNLVWVNLNTKKYHMSTASQYGTTKNGKFMTEDEAKAAGNKAAQDTPTKGKKSTATKS